MFSQPGYVDAGCGMGREATMCLTERGVQVVGTDGWSWDAPFRPSADVGPKILIRHHLGHSRSRNLLANGKAAQPEAFPTMVTVACFPVKSPTLPLVGPARGNRGKMDEPEQG